MPTEIAKQLAPPTRPFDFLEKICVEFASSPFRYAVADNFLPEPTYADLRAELRSILARGLSDSYRTDGFTRQGSMDAFSYVVPYRSGPCSDLFYSRSWFDFVSSHLNVPLLPYTLLAFHHHPPMGTSGSVHSDFNSANFLGPPATDWGLRIWAHQVPYMRYQPTCPSVQTLVRAVALIFYLDGLDDWREGDGGETGLYRSAAEESLFAKVAPLNNRLLLFENSPSSYHRYLTNANWGRNSIAQWFHVSTDESARLHQRRPNGP